jgi:hypothetical protein
VGGNLNEMLFAWIILFRREAKLISENPGSILRNCSVAVIFGRLNEEERKGLQLRVDED